jgi:hypothetical protein
MWVIVAVSLAFSGSPKVTLVPGREFDTKADCLKATRLRANFDSERGDLGFSFCVPKGSLQIGGPGPNLDDNDTH